MFRLTRLLKSSNELCRNLLCAKEVVVNGGPKSPGILSRAGVSSLSTASKSFPSSGSISDRVYADYSIFKGKAALTVSPRLPTFTKLDSGSLKVERRGVMMLTFMPAVGERKYSWEKKQVFALSPTEVGTLISLGPNDSCEFFHDPSMLSSNAGQVRKTLFIKAIGDSSGGYFISMNVVNNLLKTNERFSVPVTPGEFTVIKTACSFALPHIMGWDRVTGLQPQTAEANPSKVDRRLLDQEWDK